MSYVADAGPVVTDGSIAKVHKLCVRCFNVVNIRVMKSVVTIATRR